MSGYRLQDELRARLPRGHPDNVNPDDRYAQMLRTVLSQAQAQASKMSPAESIMIKLLAFAATNGIGDPQKRMTMQNYVNSITTRSTTAT